MVDFQKTKTIYEEEKSILTFKIYYCRDKLGQRTTEEILSPQTCFYFKPCGQHNKWIKYKALKRCNVRYLSLKLKPNVTQIPK